MNVINIYGLVYGMAEPLTQGSQTRGPRAAARESVICGPRHIIWNSKNLG